MITNKQSLTQDQLAKKVNTTKGTISNYENGYSTPSNDMLIDIANALHTTTDYLLERTDTQSADKNNEFDPMNEINSLLQKYNIDQSEFFDIDKWKAMGLEGIKQLESYFEFIIQEAEKKKKHQD